jgi:outer membrane protein assembly factor BamB
MGEPGMTIAQGGGTAGRKPLRLWPGVILAALIVFARFIFPIVAPDAEIAGLTSPMIAVMAGAAGGLAVLLWWLLFSRAQWRYRIGAVAVILATAVATSFVIDISIATGHMGATFPIYVTPLLGLALVAAAAAGRRRSARVRWTFLAVAAFVACAPMALVRTSGITGDGASDLHWRWSATPEQRLIAHAPSDQTVSDRTATPAPAPASAPPHVAKPAVETKTAAKSDAAPPAEKRESDPDRPAPPASEAEWPGFRGPRRDSIIRGARIATDWATSPPVEIWRRPVGPAWSSFAVAGDLIYTQEQRGEEEIVSCYRLSTGEPVWKHGDPVRFWESNAGAGPRATPTLHGGRVYTMGGTGLVNALDARTGAMVWSRNAAADTGKETPAWGFTSSPLVVGDVVIVAAAGRLIAYDAATGTQRWIGESGGGGYSSPHPARLEGVSQVLLQRGARTISVAPADGTPLWEHTWVPSASIVQPALAPDGGVVITTSDAMGGQGMKYLSVTRGSSGWTVQERWTSRGLKPYFNDFVVHKGHVFGFDNNILSCVDLQTGERKWKGGRYGNGQLLLLADQDVLLILSEDGELALVSATPGKFAELARVPAIESKTWNHPVLVRDVLLVRNGEKMAAFRLRPVRQ